MTSLRDKLMKAQAGAVAPFALIRELGRVSTACVRHGVVDVPLAFGRTVLKGPVLDGPFSEARLIEMVGDAVLALFDDLGPIYGKGGQILLSRLSPRLHERADLFGLTRLYKDWPPLPFAVVEEILDREIPRWRTELRVEAYPLGVASLAQVHAATDQAGRAWVVKVIKPDAARRLEETAAALEQLALWTGRVAVTLSTRRLAKELRELCVGFRRELSLSLERETIERVREKLRTRRQKLLVIPEVLASMSSERVLTVRRFVGTPMSDVVSGKAVLPRGLRQKLARSMLAELLVQVFELGLFHADPHAGNLILMDDGTVGLFDWGLAGELLESDRRHIAAILRAVVALDLERLVEALATMGEESGQTVDRDQVRRELRAVQRLLETDPADTSSTRPSLRALFEASLKGAERLGIAVPDGLLLMAKSLITIEGLARGIDPDVSLGRVATPVLLKAARPSLKDLWQMSRRLPAVARQILVR